MSDTFYVGVYQKGQLVGWVAAKFLQVDGTYVADPNTTVAQNTKIYAAPGDTTPVANANLAGLLIVPADYSTTAAAAAGAAINQASNPTLTMISAFGSFGSVSAPQDLQTNYNGQSGQPFVNAFTDAASFNFGLVSYYAGFSLQDALQGGGTLNNFKADIGLIYSPWSGIQTNGDQYGNSPTNAVSIPFGYNFGKSLATQPSLSDQNFQQSLEQAINNWATSLPPVNLDDLVPTITIADGGTVQQLGPLQIVSTSPSGTVLKDPSNGNIYSTIGDGSVASKNADGSWTLEGLAPASTSVNIFGIQGSPTFDANGNLIATFAVGSGTATVALSPTTGAVVNDPTAVTATINGQTVTLLGLGGSSPFALISNDNSVSTASAVSSNRK